MKHWLDETSEAWRPPPIPPQKPKPNGLSSSELGAKLGVSKRHIQFWTAIGIIRTLDGEGNSRHARRYELDDVRDALARHGWRGNQKAKRRAEAGTNNRACCRCDRSFPLSHYPPSAGRSGGWICSECKAPSKRADDVRRRRAKVGTQVVPVSTLVVAQRDGWRCAICGGEVTRANWSLDHVDPLSKGGAHTYENVVLAHSSCNSRRGAGRFPVRPSSDAMQFCT
jgi:5-methylcytosine-specific restriction endonuclease McrA